MTSERNCHLSDSDDSEYHSAESDMGEDNFLTSDAVDSKQPPALVKDITINHVETINDMLDLYEKVSLIFLLYRTPHMALQHIILLLQNAQINIIEEWCINEMKINNKWAEKLLEAVSIIQNYAALKKLGFKKEDMISRYVPLQKEVSLQVDLVRKYCYRLCEEFTREKTIVFLENLERDFACKNQKYISREEKKNYTIDCLEMYFLFLETEEYITSNNVVNLAHIFKQMDYLNLYDEFKDLHNKISKKETAQYLCTPKYNVDRTPHEFSRSSSSFKEVDESSETEESSVESIADIYDINPQSPGLLLIINNEYFHTESRTEYQDKLAKTDLKLENRQGSQADKSRLEETFKKLGFKIVLEDNLIHVAMLNVLHRTVRKFQHSCLVVAILSHGDQGIVYGANSVALEITEIQRIVCDKALSGKPKVLLLQACQGSSCQKIHGDDLYQTDSPKKYTPPRTTDLLTFRATISGYSAVRHVIHGTWFIQNFCKAIEENPNDHIQEICTKVIGEVSRKTWGEKCMVPLMETTFTKRLYLKAIL